jgi:hypothetical protein
MCPSGATSRLPVQLCALGAFSLTRRCPLKQRDDAERKGQVGRQKIFDGLLTRLDNREEAG